MQNHSHFQLHFFQLSCASYWVIVITVDRPFLYDDIVDEEQLSGPTIELKKVSVYNQMEEREKKKQGWGDGLKY